MRFQLQIPLPGWQCACACHGAFRQPVGSRGQYRGPGPGPDHGQDQGRDRQMRLGLGLGMGIVFPDQAPSSIFCKRMMSMRMGLRIRFCFVHVRNGILGCTYIYLCTCTSDTRFPQNRCFTCSTIKMKLIFYATLAPRAPRAPRALRAYVLGSDGAGVFVAVERIYMYHLNSESFLIYNNNGLPLRTPVSMRRWRLRTRLRTAAQWKCYWANMRAPTGPPGRQMDGRT